LRALPIALVVLALAAPAAAAELDPSLLVLRGTDVPAGFQLVPDETGIRTNALEARTSTGWSFIRRWKRVTGYGAVYERGAAKVEARADVFRAAAGAEALLVWVDREWRRTGGAFQGRATIRIGTRGVVYSSGGDAQTLVLWRHGRVFAGVNFLGLSRKQSIAVARQQERRIAAALA
jgi:hypothetical protein